jgi:hypothetical protein
MLPNFLSLPTAAAARPAGTLVHAMSNGSNSSGCVAADRHMGVLG